MSISTMTSAAVARSSAPQPLVPATSGTGLWQPPPVTTTSAPSSQLSAALATITTYIPTEILTLYVATRTAIEKPAPSAGAASTQALDVITKAANDPSEWIACKAFLWLTPIVVWFIYATKTKAAGRGIPLAPRKWPWWEIFAATVAYAAWAFGLPNSPFWHYSWYSTALAAVTVLIVSTILGLVSPLFT